MSNLAVSTSFVQDSRHVSKSPRFVPVQPSQISMVLADHGLFLNHLKTGHARHEDRAHHQTTIARYVAHDSADMVRAIGAGSSLDLLVKAPHLNGAVEFRLGFFRGTCANQWNAGKLFASVRVSHFAGCLDTIDRLIPALIGRRDELIAQIGQMQARTLNAHELAQLASGVATIRLAGAQNVENISRVHTGDLLQVRRADDRRNDLFSVANVLQENALRFSMRYDLRSQNNEGRPITRRMSTRPVMDTTASAVEMTGSIWEQAAALLAS